MFGLYRFILALLVALNHFGWIYRGFTPGGWAVICFYVLSGLLMERQFGKLAACGGTFAFYVDRFLRVYPLYLVVVLLCAATLPVNEKDLAANIALMPLNYSHFNHISNFLIPAWSLACEVHFYLLVPLFVYLSTIALRCLAATSMALFAISPFLPDSTFWAYTGLPGVLFAFLSGILINRQDWAFLRILYSTMLILCACFFFSKFAQMHLPTGIHCNVCIGYLAAIPATAFLVRLSPAIIWDRVLGLFSYPVFLVHTVTLRLGLIYIPSLNTRMYLGLTLLAAGCLIVCVELPFDWIRYRVRSASGPRVKAVSPIDSSSVKVDSQTMATFKQPK
jgi:peptidoglycan/LPS O-acetylase OafA/YrhL